jgi:hypothetical protein
MDFHHFQNKRTICYGKNDDLKNVSCIDEECSWKKIQRRDVENYKPAALMQRTCFSPSNKVQEKKESKLLKLVVKDRKLDY